MSRKDDKKYMRLALELAAKAKERTYPNPMVGAVIVKGGKVVGKGYHKKAGKDHAEVEAIKDASGNCSGGTMYVTLEPCDHYGRTPPCTQAIIKSGIKTVCVAAKDPNPNNNGNGIKKLKKHGIRVSAGLFAGESLALNRKYIKHATKGMPYITLKLAQSVDGKIAARDKTSKWITSETSRKYSRRMRSRFNAIMVGANTVLEDDPLLLGKGGKGKRITRVVVDSRLRTPFSSRLVKTAKKSPVVFATTELAPRTRLQKLKNTKGVEIIEVKSRKDKVFLKSLLKELAKKDITSVIVEGGGELAGSLIDEGLVDEVMFFISPKIIGGNYSSVKGKGAGNIANAVQLKDISVTRIGKDILVKGLV
ncbi:MAG: bifunctional diaminohydroxyphosphoribosylaminopyrimidine deaminase/5-amino-6-(5-phosphoribosylamino)uracil reductase RibD [Candidatus Omnitrophota bacterium]|jgi:diaminohydroxyphosphoribosylaminopyrimidine deaminase/5-amino-6-(5-phosphoribosylamino)uracil reductase